MKLKNLLIATLSISLFVVSCTKEDITVTKPESVLTNDVKTMSVNSTNSEVTNNKAYIFIEPKSKYPMVATYLNSTNNFKLYKFFFCKNLQEYLACFF